MTLGNALYMVLTGKELGAEEALRWGVVSEIVPHEKLMERATELATIISEGAPSTCGRISSSSGSLYKFPAPTDRASSIHSWVLSSGREDTSEGTKAFLEKRDLHYKAK
jgi:crotonobetainyl-CoA hydratase